MHQVPIVRQTVEHLPQHDPRRTVREQCGHGPHHVGRAAEGGDVESQSRQQPQMNVNQTGDFRSDLQGFRNQEGLSGAQVLVHPFTVKPGLVQHPLVGGMLIHKHHACRCLRHDVHLSNLPDYMERRQVPDNRFHAIGLRIVLAGNGQATMRPEVQIDPWQIQAQALRVGSGPLPRPGGVLMDRHVRQRSGLRHLLVRGQAVLHGMQHCRKQGPVSQAPHFRLAGMNVDIQQDRIHFNEDEAKGKPPAGQASVTSLHDRLCHRPVLNPAAVDKHIDVAPVGIVQRRRRNKTRHLDVVAHSFQGQGLTCQLAAMHLQQDLPHIAAAVGPHQHPVVVTVGKCNTRPGQRIPLHHPGHATGLCRRGLQKPLSHRRVDKQLLNLQGRALHGTRRCLVLNLAADKPEATAGGVPSMARHHGHVADSPYAEQGFAPEPQGLNAIQPFRIRQLAGGVALERQLQLVGGDAVSIVHHANEFQAAALEGHLHMAGMGIQRVFDQFPHRIDRTFNDLAGSNARHGGGRKGLY